MIDCSHANSGKDHVRQAAVAREVAAQIAAAAPRIVGRDARELPRGRPPGPRGPAQPLVYGQSITDACMSWERTEPLFDAFAEAVRARRKALAATA